MIKINNIFSEYLSIELVEHRFVGVKVSQLIIGLLLLLLVQNTWAYTPTVGAVHGHVYTRGVVLDKNNYKTYVAYNEDGTERNVIHSVDSKKYENAQVMATVQANAIVDHYKALLEEYPNAEVLSRQAFNALPDLPPNTPTVESYFNFVMIRGEAQRKLMVDGSQLVLQSFFIDPTREYSGKSLLISREGEILASSEGNIGLRVSFLQDKNNEPVYDSIEASMFARWDSGYKPVHPLVNLPVSTGEWIIGSHKTLTNADGRYHLQYYLFCPGFSFEWTIPIYVDLKYSRFNPRGQVWRTYYLTSYKYDYCSGLSALFENSTSLTGQLAYMSIMSIEATIARPWYQNNIPVDIVVFDGAAKFTNVSISQDKTRYDTSKLPLERIALDAEDFDGDGITDKVKTGKFVTTTNEAGEEEKSFETAAAADSDFQAIWLSSEHDLNALKVSKTLPSYTRLLDWSDDFDDRALLSEISEKDLQNTDIYIIRESDGTLITERRGLKQKEIPLVDNLSTWDGEVKYTIQVVNQYESRSRYGYTSRRYGSDSFKRWQVRSNMNPKFYERKADHLRIGERVKIVAINRATGYLGSETVEVKAAGGDGIAQQLSFAIPKINMYPPNLKIWAKRSSEIKHGLTKGETKEQTIGNEGAGLSDDKIIVISTEWLDHNGTPLPAALDDYGFTGRLAKVTARNTLSAKNGYASSGNSLSNFAIKPGRQTQVIKLGKDTLGEEHLYVHVSGEPQKRRPDLSSGLTEAFSGSFNSDPGKYPDGAILKYRPKLFVPVKVQVFDEKATRQSLAAWKILKKTDPSLKKPDPIYHWLYRPEFQASIYNLKVNEYRANVPEDSDIVVLEDGTSLDSTLEFLYDLKGSSNPALDAYSYIGDRELIFSFGNAEVQATVNADGKIRWNDKVDLSKLDAEDLLSIRLFSNNDSANILAEYFAVVVSTQKLYQFDNSCNYTPNNKFEDWDYGNFYHYILPIVYRVKHPNRAEFIISDIEAQDIDIGNIGIKMKLSGSDWVDTDYQWLSDKKGWKVDFDLSSQNEATDPFSFSVKKSNYTGDPVYEVYFYYDADHNKNLSNDEIPLRLRGKTEEGIQNFRVTAINKTNYDIHSSFAEENNDLLVDPKESGWELFYLFFSNHVDKPTIDEDSSHDSFNNKVNEKTSFYTYQEKHSSPLSPSKTASIRKKEQLENAWGMGAGTLWEDQSKCKAKITNFEHQTTSKLGRLVHNDRTFKKKFEKQFINTPDFKNKINTHKLNKQNYPCTITPYNSSFSSDLEASFCFTYKPATPTMGINLTTFKEYLATAMNVDESLNITAALGNSTIDVDEILVQVYEGPFYRDDYVKIFLKGEIYDFYDFTLGHLNIGRDLNTPGAWIELGYNNLSRTKGHVFSTTVKLRYKGEYDLKY